MPIINKGEQPEEEPVVPAQGIIPRSSAQATTPHLRRSPRPRPPYSHPELEKCLSWWLLQYLG